MQPMTMFRLSEEKDSAFAALKLKTRLNHLSFILINGPQDKKAVKQLILQSLEL
jgi:hypothetical protein